MLVLSLMILLLVSRLCPRFSGCIQCWSRFLHRWFSRGRYHGRWLVGPSGWYYYLHFLEGFPWPFTWWSTVFLGFDPLLQDLLEDLDSWVLFFLFIV